MAVAEPGSPEWWLRRMHGRIMARRPDLYLLHDYYDGRHKLAFATQKFLEAFGGLFRAFADNWCQIVVDSAEERLNVEGFRVGETVEGDKDAWRIWQANELDAQSQLAHSESMISGESYATVWLGDETDTPEITVESPTTADVECHPKFRRQRLAGLRLWMDEWGYEHAEVFLPDRVHLFRSRTQRSSSDSIVDGARVQWMIDDAISNLDIEGSMPNPLGVVPMVPLPNRPRLAFASRPRLASQSEITVVMPVQDAVNKLVMDMIVAAEYAAYPQRYMLGLEELPRNPEGQEINPYTPDKRVWLGEGDATAMKVGEFATADLSNYVHAIEMLIGHVASITRTPPHYLSPSADRLSGESIKAAETGLVAKVRRKQRHLGEAWEEVMRLSGQLAGIDRLAQAEGAETIWQDPESRNEAQFVDSVVKKATVGVPEQQLWEDLRYSPQQIARFEEWRKANLAAGVLVPQPLGVTVRETGPGPQDVETASGKAPMPAGTRVTTAAPPNPPAK